MPYALVSLAVIILILLVSGLSSAGVGVVLPAALR